MPGTICSTGLIRCRECSRFLLSCPLQPRAIAASLLSWMLTGTSNVAGELPPLSDILADSPPSPRWLAGQGAFPVDCGEGPRLLRTSIPHALLRKWVRLAARHTQEESFTPYRPGSDLMKPNEELLRTTLA